MRCDFDGRWTSHFVPLSTAATSCEHLDVNAHRNPAVVGASLVWALLASCAKSDRASTEALPGPALPAAAAAPLKDATVPVAAPKGDVWGVPGSTEASGEPMIGSPATATAADAAVDEATDEAARLALLAAAALGEGDPRARAEALFLIGEMRSIRGVPVLEQALADPVPAVRRATVESLVAIGGMEVNHALRLAAADPDPAVRGLALDAIEEFAEGDLQ